MQRKYSSIILIFLSISMASMVFGCGSNNGTIDNSKSDDLKILRSAFTKNSLRMIFTITEIGFL